MKPKKPKKPYPTFPLTPTPRGWVKKIHGKLYWFGPAHDPDGALAKYHDRAKELHAATPVSHDPHRISVQELADRYLDLRRGDADNADLSIGWYAKTYAAVTGFVKHVGGSTRVADLTPDHFAAFKQSVRFNGMNNQVRAVRAWIRHADGEEWCGHVRMGKKFLPDATPKERTELLFTPDECRKLIDATSERDPMRAWVLLALNGGMGQKDLATLTVDSVTDGWLANKRHKTGERRRFPLWAETAEAVKWHMGGKTADALMFRTERGHPIVREKVSKNKKVSTIDRVAPMFDDLMEQAGVPKNGRNFYTLRRTFRTIADEQGDQRAIAVVMGHALQDIGGVYVQRISDERLSGVVNFVRSVIIKTASPSRRRRKREPVGA